MSAPPIFRKAALERLSSPERLDELMQVTRPRAWLALVALALVILAGVAWSIWGSVRWSVVGEGSLVGVGGALEAVVNVAPHEGRAVRPGMRVELLPENVTAQDSGYLLGVVRSVSGPPYQLHIDLVRDPSRGGGLRWSSTRAPPAVESGTSCTARVITRTERPIDLVLPGRASPRAVSGR